MDAAEQTTFGIQDALDLLDAGRLPAIAIDPRQRVVRAVNATFADQLEIDPDDVEDEAVHTIVHQAHHDLVDAILSSIAQGVQLGPIRVALRLPEDEDPRGSLWARITGAHDTLGSTVIMLCKPFAEHAEIRLPDPENPDNHPGFGRIPPNPDQMGS